MWTNCYVCSNFLSLKKTYFNLLVVQDLFWMAELSIHHSFNFLLLHQDICDDGRIANANLRFNSCKYLGVCHHLFWWPRPLGFMSMFGIAWRLTKMIPSSRCLFSFFPFEGIYWTQDRKASVIIMPNLNVPSYIFYWRRSRAFVTFWFLYQCVLLHYDWQRWYWAATAFLSK